MPTCLTAPQVAAVSKIYGGATQSAHRRANLRRLAAWERSFRWFADRWMVRLLRRPKGAGAHGFLAALGLQRSQLGSGARSTSIATWLTPIKNGRRERERHQSQTVQSARRQTGDVSRLGRPGGAAGGWRPLLHAGGEGHGRSGKTKDFFRLFMAPGMGHCGGGPGPNTFDAMGALDKWVAQGTAPEKIVASHSTNGNVDRTRPLCPYPQVARWKGSGSTDDAANFTCVSPTPRPARAD